MPNFQITTIAPITHTAFSEADTGNITTFRRLPMLHEGMIYNVPVISGNAVRGLVRRALAAELVERYDLRTKLDKLFDKWYVACANGGMLGKELDVAVRTEKLRQLRQMFPMISVLGSSLYRYMLPGVCNVGFWIPRCIELGNGEVSIDEVVCDVSMTHLFDRTVATVDGVKPMPYIVEAMIPGVVLDGSVSFAPQATDVEIACVYHGLRLISAVGGKQAAGYGAVQIDGLGDDAAYLDWLAQDQSEAMLSFAEDL